MSGESEFTRRQFVAGAVSAAVATTGAVALVARSDGSLASAATARGKPAANATSNGARLFVFDPEHADACQRIEGGAAQGCATLPVTGDRVRLGRELFAPEQAPTIVAGLTHYADYILLSGCAAEHGYRVQSVQVQAHLVEWTVAKQRRAISS